MHGLMRSITSNWAATATIALVLGLTAGCTVGPHYHAPAPPAIASYTPQPQPNETVSSTGPAGSVQHLNPSAEIPAQWWSLFQSPELNSMVNEALQNSPTLAQATARLKQAQEELSARTGATKYPSVTGNASAQAEQLNLAAYGIPLQNPSPFLLLNGSVAVSYALDLFGANRHLIEGLRAEREYQQWQLEGARLMLAGNVVSAVIRQAELQEQIEITRQMLEVQQQELSITQQRYHAGGVSDYDLRSQRTAVAQIEATLSPLEQQSDAIHDQLALLMGKSPAEAHIPSISLASLRLPEQLPVSLPSSLVRQRPDIRATEALLHQASANVGVATANQYPQIILSGSGGAIGTNFTAGGDIWNVGSSLTQPIFNGGSSRAEKRKAQAAYDEAGDVYRQTVLEAFREVADALYAIQHDAETLQARGEAASEAQAAYHIASQRYAAGGISHLNLLDAQRQQLQTALDRTNSAASRYADSVTLLQALGGGWWNQTHTATPVAKPGAKASKASPSHSSRSSLE
jgi:NodT family efflux transporter outer membrane factor (OMF) lipoprotein